jgi:hypothetical protein
MMKPDIFTVWKPKRSFCMVYWYTPWRRITLYGGWLNRRPNFGACRRFPGR